MLRYSGDWWLHTAIPFQNSAFLVFPTRKLNFEQQCTGQMFFMADSKTVWEATDIHINVNSSARLFILLLPEIFMILLGQELCYTGSGWHQDFSTLIPPYHVLLCLFLWATFITSQTRTLLCEKECHSLVELILRKFALQFNPHFSFCSHPFNLQRQVFVKILKDNWQKLLIHFIIKRNQHKRWKLQYPKHNFF